jgi:flagellar hook protein FlgE
VTTSFYTAFSGMKSQQFGLDVWGNNIANINTTGFRSSTPEFSTLLSQYKSGMALSGMDEVGVGATSQTTALSMAQGSFVDSESSLSLAIGGDGWFGVKKANDPTQLYFTRAGDFSTDSAGNVVNGNGDNLVGTYTGNMTIAKNGTASVAATTSVPANMLKTPAEQVSLKLPSNLTHPGYPAVAATYATMPTFTTNLVGGKSADINYSLTKDTTPKIVITDASGATVRTITSSTQTAGNHTVTWDGKDNNGNALATGTYNINITYVDKPAIPAIGIGYLNNYQVDENGLVIATFSNGQSTAVAQVPLFHFQNDQGLEKVGESEFKASDNSGKPIFYKDAKGNTLQGANIVSQKLEVSNVSAAEALTQLLITEKAYSANAKVITTSDQMIQKAIALKRG